MADFPSANQGADTPFALLCGTTGLYEMAAWEEGSTPTDLERAEKGSCR